MLYKSNTSRRHFIKSLSCTTLFSLFKGCSNNSFSLPKIRGAKSRNIIFILCDDHRYDFMGFLGKPKFLDTPNLDRLAREGAHLGNAFVITSLCSPSRATVLTGQYTHRHGVFDNRATMPEETIIFPQYLQKIGYQTAFIGKWHISGSDDSPKAGFNHWISFPGQGRYYDPIFNINGKQVEKKGYNTDLLTDFSLDWLEKQIKRDDPYCLYLSYKAVHAKFEPAERHRGRFSKVQLEYPETMAKTEENYLGKPKWVKEQRNSIHGVEFPEYNQVDFESTYRQYCETLLSVDENIGRILDFLKRAGQDESTLIIYMGDNGFFMGEHGLVDKRAMYEESIRVPLLAHCPEIIEPGKKIDKMVQNIDIAPTLLEAAGLKPPKNMDGNSFLPLLEGKDIPWREEIFYEYFWEWNYPPTPTVHGIRTERYKYMRYHGIWDCDELYDLQNDPKEKNNLINSPEYQELKKELNNKVWEWLEKTNGMFIPLRRDIGNQYGDRNPAFL